MAETLKLIPLAKIRQNERNLRTDGAQDVEDLAASIAFIGVLEPPVVRKDGEFYELIAGERRLNACNLLVSRGEWTKDASIKCVVRTGMDDEKVMASFLIENMQRVDLTPAEQAEGVVALLQEHGMSEADVAANLGVNKQWVKDRIGIAQLPDHIRSVVGKREGGIPVAHAGMLASLPSDRIERLTKDDNVPGQYDIENAASKVKSEVAGDTMLRKLKNGGYMVVTEKELKRIMKADLGNLGGEDWTIKSLIADASEVVTDYWRQADHTVVRLDRIFKFNFDDADKKTLYVQRKVGGFIEWAKATTVPAKGAENPDIEVEPDPYDEMEARNDAKRDQYRQDRRAAEAQFVEQTKPAELINTLLWAEIYSIQVGYRSWSRAVDVCQRLGLDYADIDDATDIEVSRENHQANMEAIEKFAGKSAANLARAAASVAMTDRHAFPVEYPAEPEYEEWEGDEEEADGLVGF